MGFNYFVKTVINGYIIIRKIIIGGMVMSIKGFKFTDLKQEELHKITSLETDLNSNNNESMILLAFEREE